MPYEIPDKSHLHPVASTPACSSESSWLSCCLSFGCGVGLLGFRLLAFRAVDVEGSASSDRLGGKCRPTSHAFLICLLPEGRKTVYDPND